MSSSVVGSKKNSVVYFIPKRIGSLIATRDDFGGGGFSINIKEMKSWTWGMSGTSESFDIGGNCITLWKDQ